jgi:AcrR family transcriptional regulator
MINNATQKLKRTHKQEKKKISGVSGRNTPMSARSGSAAARRESTRLRIKETARAIFAQKGFDAANVSDIVSKLGLAQGTFYYHFSDKKSILVEMLNDFFTRVKKLASSWARTEDTGSEAAALFARTVATILYENRDIAAIIRRESHNPDMEIRRMIKDFYGYLYRQTALGLELGIRLGVVRKLDTHIAAVALIGMIEEVVGEQLEIGKPVDIESVVQEISELQNYGIRPRKMK